MRDDPDSAVTQRRKELVALLGSAAHLRKLRHAHAHLSDHDYEGIKAEHRARLEPLYRSTLVKRSGSHKADTPTTDEPHRDRSVALRVTITSTEYERLRSVATRRGWSDTQALREAIRLLTATHTGESEPHRTPAQVLDVDGDEVQGRPTGVDQEQAKGKERTRTKGKATARKSQRADGPSRTRSPVKRKGRAASPRPNRPRPPAKAARTSRPAEKSANGHAQDDSGSIAKDAGVRLRPVLPADMGGGAYDDIAR